MLRKGQGKTNKTLTADDTGLLSLIIGCLTTDLSSQSQRGHPSPAMGSIVDSSQLQ